jgi:hypothetical protein
LQALVKLIALCTPADMSLADALVMAGYSMQRAGAHLDISESAVWQRLTRLVSRIERKFPAVRFDRGPATPAIHYGYDLSRLKSESMCPECGGVSR